MLESINKSIRNVKVNTARVLLSYVFITVFFLLYYGIAGYKEDIPSFLLGLETSYFFSYFFLILFSAKIKNLKFVLFVIFTYTLFISGIVRFFFLEYTNLPFYYAIDSYKYDSYVRFAINANLTYNEFVSFLLGRQTYGVDDLGFFSVLFVIYKISGSVYVGQTVMLLVNAILVTLSSKVFYKLLSFYDIPSQSKFFLLAVFGFFPFFSMTSAVGLKENFFVFIIVQAFYYMLLYKYTRKRNILVMFVFYALIALFFRSIILLMLFLSFFVEMRSRGSNRTRLLYFLLLGGLFSFFLLDVIIQQFAGRSLNAVLMTTEARSENINMMGGGMMWVINLLAVLVGPFPNYSNAAIYGILNTPGLQVKVLLNIFFLIGGYEILKEKDYKYYSIIIYWLLGAIMLVVSGVALDMRYQVTFYPLMFPVIYRGLQRKIPLSMYLLTFSFLSLLIYFYNNR